MRKGDKITAVRPGFDGQLRSRPWLACGVVRLVSGGQITFSYRWENEDNNGGVDTVAAADRGITWARGHDGREVDALKTAIALS